VPLSTLSENPQMRVQFLTAMALAALPTTRAFAQATSAAGAAKQPAPKLAGPSTPQLLVSSLVGGSDNCATAAANDAISGLGTFSVTNAGATNGAPDGPGCVSTQLDVWLYWTSTVTGTVIIDSCGGIGADSVLAVWNDGASPGTCPTTLVGCNDDFCGLQSQVSFAAVTGNKYFIQWGGYGAATTYSGTFNISTPPPPTGNDDCTLPVAVVGNGPHAFDSTNATTGTQGQSEPLCLAFGTTAIYKDLWFTWNATATGNFQISLCNSTFHDSRVAVYLGSGCPTGAALACNDDSCGLVSSTCFSAVSGQNYTIQIGAYASTVGGTGDFVFSLAPPITGSCATIDDGGTENSVGWTAGGTFAWMNTYGGVAFSATVSSVSTSYGALPFPGGYFPSPTSMVTVAVWEDPNDDGNPSDAILLGTGSAVVSPGSVETDVLQTIALNAPVITNGVFFIGAMVDHVAGEFVSPLDQTTVGAQCGAQAYFFGTNTPGTINLANLNANQYPPASAGGSGFPGTWLLRPNCGPGSTGSAYCFGDLSGTACPCGNIGTAGNGCPSSVNPSGANLTATGSAVVGADTVTLVGTGMPNVATALYFQGTAQTSTLFGDGLRCVGGTVIRLGTKTNAGGASQYPAPGDLTVSVRGAVPAGATRNYQCWYRNAAAFCTASTFNLTNGMQIVWQ